MQTSSELYELSDVLRENEYLRGLIAELLDTELSDIACVGSMSPVEDIIGRMNMALMPNAPVQPPVRREPE
jgi:hypothetical protein